MVVEFSSRKTGISADKSLTWNALLENRASESSMWPERAKKGENRDFALVIRPDGAVHVVMKSAFSLDGAAAYGGAQSAFGVTRSRDGVRVTGSKRGQSLCPGGAQSVQGIASRPAALPDYFAAPNLRLDNIVNAFGEPLIYSRRNRRSGAHTRANRASTMPQRTVPQLELQSGA